MTTDGERLAILEEWKKGHDRFCAEERRKTEHVLLGFQNEMSRLSNTIESSARFQNRTVLAILLALLAWGGKELWYTRGAVAAGGAAYVATREASPAVTHP